MQVRRRRRREQSHTHQPVMDASSDTGIESDDDSTNTDDVDDGSGLVCVECSTAVPYIYRIYTQKSIRLLKCPHCDHFVDKYVEMDHILIAIDMFLHLPQVYRHLIYNRYNCNQLYQSQRQRPRRRLRRRSSCTTKGNENGKGKITTPMTRHHQFHWLYKLFAIYVCLTSFVTWLRLQHGQSVYSELSQHTHNISQYLLQPALPTAWYDAIITNHRDFFRDTTSATTATATATATSSTTSSTTTTTTTATTVQGRDFYIVLVVAMQMISYMTILICMIYVDCHWEHWRWRGKGGITTSTSSSSAWSPPRHLSFSQYPIVNIAFSLFTTIALSSFGTFMILLMMIWSYHWQLGRIVNLFVISSHITALRVLLVRHHRNGINDTVDIVGSHHHRHRRRQQIEWGNDRSRSRSSSSSSSSSSSDITIVIMVVIATVSSSSIGAYLLQYFHVCDDPSLAWSMALL